MTQLKTQQPMTIILFRRLKFLFLLSEHVQSFCRAAGNNRGATEIVSLLFVLFTPHG